jgi:aminocarboxymuconate-semialdehyde decarboxylase
MERMGVEMQAISPSPVHYHYWADEELAAELVDHQLECVAEICAAHPDRFVGLGTVALQHPQLALSQLEACVRKYGFKGVQISSAYPGGDLSDSRFEPFWRRAAELKTFILIHPLGSSLRERTASYYLSNIIGQPLDTTLALSHLIFSGVFDRHPALKVCAVHGGGFLPAYIGRFDHGWDVRPEAHVVRQPPSAYLKQIYFDTVVFSPNVLRNLINAAGIDNVLLGTDYPYDMGDYEIIQLIDKLPELDESGRLAIQGKNAQRLLGLQENQGEPEATPLSN